MRTTPALLTLLLLVSVVATGCRPQDGAARAGDASVEVIVTLPQDATVGPAAIEVRLEEDGAPLSGADVEVTGDMTHAGMTPVVAAARDVGDGSYRTDAFAFTMAGDWILSVEAVLPDGRRATGEAATTVRRP